MLLFIGFIVLISASAQHTGKVLEQRTIKSNTLGRNVKYSVYLPADYDQSERAYPVVYLLHGYTDDNTGWLQFGEINRYADKAIAEGLIPSMVIVMPNADSSWYINSYDGKEKYEDFFIKEFIPGIEKTYRIKGEKRYRGIAGDYSDVLLALSHDSVLQRAGSADESDRGNQDCRRVTQRRSVGGDQPRTARPAVI